MFPIGIYRYHQGSHLGTINFVWKIPEAEEFNDEQNETLKVRMLARIHEGLPHYFTRQMQKNVLNKYSYIQKVTPAVLRMLHFDLTGNAAVSSNSISREVEERLQLMLTLADPTIISDLRTNNGFDGTKFNIFWDETEAYFNEQNLLAVDERRHETILYMPLALSVRDLREIIMEKLYIIHGNPLPFTIHIPSEEWIRLQFCPTNAIATRSIHHTGRFNVKFKVQGRLLQKNSDDAHYCAALFRYLREYCIKYHQWTCLISADDKHKVPIGEDVAVSTGLSLTPSVTFFISIPEDIFGSFYDGQVFVSYKDTTFEPSSAIRHSTEFLNALNIQYEHQVTPPILCLYTDGGPDHRCNYGSVQIALIALFLQGDFDMLIAVRTVPNHSWTNPAERIMSILNLGLQGVALKRNQMSPESEALFETANTLDDIRKKAQEFNELNSELIESIANIQDMLNNRTERLVLKDKKFKCHGSASEEIITKLFEKSIFVIDPTLKIDETTQSQIRRHSALIEFMDTHCHARAYSFQIKKCNNPTCPYCKPIRLPSQEFHDLSFLPDPIPSQEYRPTYMQSQANAEPIPKSILVVGKIRGYIDCEDCKKRRCVYSDKFLNSDEQQDFQQVLESYSYSCGAPIFPDDHYLKEVVFVRTRINCDSPIEVLYYSSRKSGNYPICYYCGESEGLVAPPESLKQRFKQIYPLCEMCIENRKGFHTKGEIKTNGRASKRRKT
ncbi:hypothetical protein GLOIN_2v1780244 [Rhizophagus irregularis DAOM 181602=DAOM 197198]|nr:hypothetical protein GLOIN_2v1780244 [Rhizophagus irregularis DAOM 181602=DAOM 197198]